MFPKLKIQTCHLNSGVGTGRNSTYAIFLDVTRCMERLHTFGRICDGIQERDLLYAVGYFVENDSHALMNCRYGNYRISRTIRRTMIFSFDFLEKNNDECILILVIYWKKTGLVHTKLATII